MTIRVCTMAFAVMLVVSASAARSADAQQQAVPETEKPTELDERDLVEEDDYVLRLSLPTEEDFEVWRQPGFRLQLGIGTGVATGQGTAADFSGTAILMRPQVRLDARWSLAVSFGYDIVSGDFNGLRWHTALEPVFHPIDGVGLTAGVGYTGLSGDRTDADLRNDPQFVADRIDATITRDAKDDELLAECVGSGWFALTRAEYLFVVGPLFATGPYVAGDIRRTRCSQGVGPTNNETGEPVEIRRWWTHLSWRAGWLVTWR